MNLMLPTKMFDFFLFQYNTLRVIPESDYCTRSDIYKYLHEDVVNEDVVIMIEKEDLPRVIIKKKAYEAIPFLRYTFPPSTNVFEIKLKDLSIYSLGPLLNFFHTTRTFIHQ